MYNTGSNRVSAAASGSHLPFHLLDVELVIPTQTLQNLLTEFLKVCMTFGNMLHLRVTSGIHEQRKHVTLVLNVCGSKEFVMQKHPACTWACLSTLVGVKPVDVFD